MLAPPLTTPLYEYDTTAEVAELDCREDSDYKVELVWEPKANAIYLRLTDKHYNIRRVYRVPNAEARHAFLHPFCYV